MSASISAPVRPSDDEPRRRLYHYNPWTDTTEGVCPSFSSFRASPTQFFLNRFPGMTHAVADFPENRVFCILPDPVVVARCWVEASDYSGCGILCGISYWLLVVTMVTPLLP